MLVRPPSLSVEVIEDNVRSDEDVNVVRDKGAYTSKFKTCQPEFECTATS